MFLNYIKNYFLLKILKNNLDNVKSSKDLTLIQTVGLLIDESYFLEKEDLISELIANGIQESNIKIIVYRDKLKKNEVYTQPSFGTKHLNWNAQITDATLREFIKDKFDLKDQTDNPTKTIKKIHIGILCLNKLKPLSYLTESANGKPAMIVEYFASSCWY